MVVQLHNLKNIFLVQDLRKKLGFTLFVFAVYRLGAHITLPGVDAAELYAQFGANFASGFLSYMDIFSGGALRMFSIFSMGMGPYISASIMIQLLTIMVPSLEALSKDGEHGRRIINQYTRYLTLGIGLIQAFGLVAYVENQQGLVVDPGWGFRIPAVLLMTVGSLVVMWLGEQINAHGIGNGSSMIIFAGIVVNLPGAVVRIWDSYQQNATNLLVVALLLAITLAVIACVIFLEKGERKVPVQYAKRVIGQKVYGGQSSYLPLKLNPAGVVPVIFAQAILGMPVMIISMFASRWPDISRTLNEWFAPHTMLYGVFNVGLIIFFAFFYTAIIFNPVELAENIRKSGGFIPGIRPGKKTAEFFDYLLTRVGFPGAVYLALLAVLPDIVALFVHFPAFFSGVSLLIVIGVGLDTSAQIESHLIERRYEGFLASGRLKGRFNR